MGLSFLTSYTWSKTISDAADGLWNRADGIRDNYCRACERAVSSYDQPQRFIANVTYELPFGRGKAMGSNWNGVMNSAFGGWQMNGILTLSKGLPLYNFAVAINNCFCFGGGQRPDWSGVKPVVENQNIDRWFDTSQFSQPAAFTYGNLGRTMTAVRQDGATQLDFSVFKTFQPVERMESSSEPRRSTSRIPHCSDRPVRRSVNRPLGLSRVRRIRPDRCDWRSKYCFRTVSGVSLWLAPAPALSPSFPFTVWPSNASDVASAFRRA